MCSSDLGEVSEIKEIMKKSRQAGMQTFDQALFDLYEGHAITYEDALRNADSVNDLRLQIKLNSQRGKTQDLAAGWRFMMPKCVIASLVRTRVPASCLRRSPRQTRTSQRSSCGRSVERPAGGAARRHQAEALDRAAAPSAARGCAEPGAMEGDHHEPT